MKYYFLLAFFLVSVLQLTAQGDMDSTLALAIENGKYGFKKNSEFVISAIYDSAFNFSEGSAAVKQNGRWFYITESGKMYHDNGHHDTPPTFLMAKPYYNGVAVVVFDYSGYEDILEGMEMIGARGYTASDYHHFEPMDSIGDFTKGYSYIKDEGKYGILGSNYQILVPIAFDRIDSFSNGWAKVTDGERTFVLNPLGECYSNCTHGMRTPRKATADYRTIYIAHGGNSIQSRAKFQLRSLIKDLQKQPNRKVFIKGNGTASYVAMQKSWECADAVANYLEVAGIDRSRMILDYANEGKYGTVSILLVDQSVTGPSRLPPPHPVNMQRK